MKPHRSREPGLWLLFSAGGTLTALLLPMLVFVLWVAPSLGWMEPLTHAAVAPLARHVLVRLLLFVLVTLSLYHWAHRFRYTLYDGLQLYHLNRLIAVLTYGTATALTAVGAFIVWG
jgi:fumarate reductase subunit D